MSPFNWCLLCPQDHQQHFPQSCISVAEHWALPALELSIPESNCVQEGKQEVLAGTDSLWPKVRK